MYQNHLCIYDTVLFISVIILAFKMAPTFPGTLMVHWRAVPYHVVHDNIDIKIYMEKKS